MVCHIHLQVGVGDELVAFAFGIICAHTSMQYMWREQALPIPNVCRRAHLRNTRRHKMQAWPQTASPGRQRRRQRPAVGSITCAHMRRGLDERRAAPTPLFVAARPPCFRPWALRRLGVAVASLACGHPPPLLARESRPAPHRPGTGPARIPCLTKPTSWLLRRCAACGGKINHQQQPRAFKMGLVES